MNESETPLVPESFSLQIIYGMDTFWRLEGTLMSDKISHIKVRIIAECMTHDDEITVSELTLKHNDIPISDDSLTLSDIDFDPKQVLVLSHQIDMTGFEVIAEDLDEEEEENEEENGLINDKKTNERGLRIENDDDDRRLGGGVRPNLAKMDEEASTVEDEEAVQRIHPTMSAAAAGNKTTPFESSTRKTATGGSNGGGMANTNGPKTRRASTVKLTNSELAALNGGGAGGLRTSPTSDDESHTTGTSQSTATSFGTSATAPTFDPDRDTSSGGGFPKRRLSSTISEMFVRKRAIQFDPTLHGRYLMIAEDGLSIHKSQLGWRTGGCALVNKSIEEAHYQKKLKRKRKLSSDSLTFSMEYVIKNFKYGFQIGWARTDSIETRFIDRPLEEWDESCSGVFALGSMSWCNDGFYPVGRSPFNIQKELRFPQGMDRIRDGCTVNIGIQVNVIEKTIDLFYNGKKLGQAWRDVPMQGNGITFVIYFYYYTTGTVFLRRVKNCGFSHPPLESIVSGRPLMSKANTVGVTPNKSSTKKLKKKPRTPRSSGQM